MKLLKVGLIVFGLGCYSLSASLTFSNDASKFILQTDVSRIRLQEAGVYDNLASGITNNINRIDLGSSTSSVIVMDNDFVLEAGYLFSTTGTIQGNGHSLILNGDLIIPAMTTLKITSDLVIEGNGHEILVDTFAQLLTDTHATLTLRNLVLKNVVNTAERPALAAAGADSKIALDNVSIYLGNSFWFNQGSLFFHNNVLYAGESKFIYGSAQSSFIAPNSTLLFDKASTFFYSPQSTSDNLIIQQAPSATIYFDSATLQTTPTGLSLNNGRMFVENQTTLDVGTEFNSSLFALNQLNCNINLHYLDWNNTGEFLTAAGLANGLNYDQVKVYQLASTSLTQIGSIQYGSLSSIVYAAAWSPDGNYLAIGGCGAKSGVGGFTDSNSLRIYFFDNKTLALNPFVSVDFGSTSTISSIDWGGTDDYYIAVGGTGALPVGGFANNDNLRLYHLNKNQGTISPITSYNYGSSVNDAKWNFSGVYIAVGGYQGIGSCTLDLLYFNFASNSLSLVDTKSFGIAAETTINTLDWSNDSQFLAVGGGSVTNYATSNQNMIIYSFDPANIIPLTFLTYASPVEIASTDHIEIKNLSWSTDNKLIFYSGINPATGNWASDIYYFRSDFDVKLSELKSISKSIAVAQYASAWNPATNLFMMSFADFIETDLLVGISPKLASNQAYTTNYSTDDGVYSVNWTPGGDFLAVGGQGASAVGGFSNTDEIRVYRFEGVSETLNPLTTQSYGQRVSSVQWSPDGNYLGVGGINPTYAAGGFLNEDHFRVYSFDSAALSARTSIPVGDSTAELYSIAWHPSGKYVALGCYNSGDIADIPAGTNLRIYSFDGEFLGYITGYHFGDAFLTPAALAWSPDGSYLAVGTCQGQPTTSPTTGQGLFVFQFTNYTSLVQKTTWNATTAILNVNWEFDNRFIAVTYNNNYNPLSFGMLYFNGGSLNEVKSWNSSIGALNVNFFNTDVKASPDGKKIAYAGKNGVANDFGYLAINDFDFKNESFYYQKVNGSFNALSLAWRPDSKYIAMGSFDVTIDAPQIAVLKVENLININRQSAKGLNLGKLIDINILGNALININGVMSYASE